MIYPYHCTACDFSFDVSKSMHDSGRHEPCPKCGRVVKEQDYRAKRVTGHLDVAHSWSEGRAIMQLPAGHPDHMVSNRRDMERAYEKNGICMDTGKFVSKEAQVKATLPPKKRHISADMVVGGLREEG